MSYLVSSPFSALGQLNRELTRMFDDRPFPAAARDAARWTPPVDISESEDAFRVWVDVPGVDPADIEISLHQGVLTIKGERNTDSESGEGGFYRRERNRGSFVRQFTLPDSADEDTVSATSVNGVLQITIPKARRARPINITVDGD